MNRLISVSALLFATALAAGCAGMPGTGPTPGTGGTPAPVDGDAARAALCASGSDTSLVGLATQIESVTDDTDVSAMNTAIDTAISNLDSAQLDPTQAVVGHAAVKGLTEFQGALNEPATRDQLASGTANVLRAADGEICG